MQTWYTTSQGISFCTVCHLRRSGTEHAILVRLIDSELLSREGLNYDTPWGYLSNNRHCWSQQIYICSPKGTFPIVPGIDNTLDAEHFTSWTYSAEGGGLFDLRDSHYSNPGWNRQAFALVQISVHQSTASSCRRSFLFWGLLKFAMTAMTAVTLPTGLFSWRRPRASRDVLVRRVAKLGLFFWKREVWFPCDLTVFYAQHSSSLFDSSTNTLWRSETSCTRSWVLLRSHLWDKPRYLPTIQNAKYRLCNLKTYSSTLRLPHLS